VTALEVYRAAEQLATPQALEAARLVLEQHPEHQLALPRWSAPASTYPCQLYRTHAPRPTRTQWHHRFPEYLQRRVWGETRVEDPPMPSSPHMLWLCGTCHDSVHDWISYLVDGWRRPDPPPGTSVRREAQHAVAMYRLALEGWTV
jgi:hypothetical protein